MIKLKLRLTVCICLHIVMLPSSVLYAQYAEKTFFNSVWQTLDGNWINTSAINSKAVIIRKDMHKETQWKSISIDFKLGAQANEKYIFGFALNAENSSKFGLVRFFTLNNVTNLQVGIWEYGYFRAYLNTPIEAVLTPDITYKAIIEPNVNRKDWRPWNLKLINTVDGKTLFQKTLANTMPLLGMGIAGMYTEGAKVDFLDFSVKLIQPGNTVNELKLAPLFQNKMVLQRNKKVMVWGMANRRSEVVISIAGKKYVTTADSQGKWSTLIGPLNATKTTQMSVRSGNSNIVLTNVAIGEVWLASGQSNMEMRIWQTDVAKKYADNRDSGVHVFMQPGWPSESPLFNSGGEWLSVNDTAFVTTSAIAYAFASKLRDELKVPVGIICSYWGGTGAETWMPRDVLNDDSLTQPIIKDYEVAEIALKERKKVDVNPWFVPGQNKAPGALFNGMIMPHVPYSIRGVIWYQGESNADRSVQYKMLFPMLIKSWRDAWKDPEMPFLFAQLPKYDGGQSGAEIKNAWPAIREAQRLTLQKVAHTGMAIILDLGNTKSIHPYLKEEVGIRLSRLALHDVYGLQKIVRSGPLFTSTQFDNGRALVHFTEVAKGLRFGTGDRLQGFVIAGNDKKFVPAQAIVEKEGKVVSVYSDKVKTPVAVRYAWANNPEDANLINSEGLPASPFRTDNWELFDR